MASPAITQQQREPIKLTAMPQVFALRFTQAKQLDKPGFDGRRRAMFSSSDGRPLFLSDEEASDMEHQLDELGVSAHEPISVSRPSMRNGGFAIRVERVSTTERMGPRTALVEQLERSIEQVNQVKNRGDVPMPVEAPPPNSKEYGYESGSHPGQINDTPTLNRRFLAAYMVAVDTLIEARTYAQRKGLALEVKCEDVRCLAATLVIDSQKGGRA